MSLVHCDADSFGEQSETHLIAVALTDPAAFGELYQRHLRRVFHYLLTYTESVDDASDLTQLVFMRAIQALPTYQDRGMPFAAWLLRIARNLATDTYRRRRKTIPWEHVPVRWHPFSSEDPELSALQRESINQLRLLVAQLDPGKQELISLRFAAELSVSEIAVVVGKSEAAVQRQLHRTIQILKEQYRATQI